MNKKQKKGSDHVINFFIYFFIRSDTFNSPFYLNELSDLNECDGETLFAFHHCFTVFELGLLEWISDPAKWAWQ